MYVMRLMGKVWGPSSMIIDTLAQDAPGLLATSGICLYGSVKESSASMAADVFPCVDVSDTPAVLLRAISVSPRAFPWPASMYPME